MKTTEQVLAEYMAKKHKSHRPLNPDWVKWAFDVIRKCREENCVLNEQWLHGTPVSFVTPSKTVFDNEPPIDASPKCKHQWRFQATVFWRGKDEFDGYHRRFERVYGDRYYCQTCLETIIINHRAIGICEHEPYVGTLPM